MELDESKPMDVVEDATDAPMSAEALQEAIEKERELKVQDASIRAFLAAKNSMESFILEMRLAPKRKFGDTINTAELNAVRDQSLACRDGVILHMMN